MTLFSGSPQPHDIGHAIAHLRSRWPWFAGFGAIAALLVLGWPQNSHYVLGLFLGVDMMMYGASQLAFAMFLRRRFRPLV